MSPRAPWLGAVEGYYGPPLERTERLALVEWLGTQGFNAYGYAPKDDPFHRARWREPYPPEREEELAELVAAGAGAGVDVALVVSPGLDWRPGEDEPVLAAKLARFAEMGAPIVGVAWDDVATGGAELGEAHGRGIAAAAAATTGIPMITCPTDYATSVTTDYLRAYAAAAGPDAEIMWTGPSIVSAHVPADLARQLGEALDRPLLFAENFPVNDGAMTGVLHVGPYPVRDQLLPTVTSGVFCNFMSRPRASRVGLAAAARFWRDPTADRELAWLEALDAVPGMARSPAPVGRGPAIPVPIPNSGVGPGRDRRRPRPLRQYLWSDVRAGLDPVLLPRWSRGPRNGIANHTPCSSP